MQASQSQLQLVGPSALSSQQPATGELAANLLAYANQLQQLPPQLPGDVRERVRQQCAWTALCRCGYTSLHNASGVLMLEQNTLQALLCII